MTQIPLEATFPVTALGGGGDEWLSSSGNKITDVQVLGDGKHIYLSNSFLPEVPIPEEFFIAKFILSLNSQVISSQGYRSEQFPLYNIYDFLSYNAPGQVGWTMQQFKDYEIGVADNTFVKVESYKALVQGLGSIQIIKAGVRAALQHQPVGNQMQLRVLKMEKLLFYTSNVEL